MAGLASLAATVFLTELMAETLTTPEPHSPPDPAGPEVPRASTDWRPPSAEALAEHLEVHAPTPVSPWARRGPWLGFAVLVGLALAVGGVAAWLLPWAGFIGLIVYGGRRVRALRRLDARLNRAQELITLRHYRPALRQVWGLIEELQPHPAMQHRAVMILTQALDELGAHEAALIAYDRLLGDLPGEHPGAIYLKVHRAIASLFEHRLADADEALARLRGPVEEMPDSPAAAAFRFARLFQAVQTAHYHEAIAESDGLLESLRPWGVHAAYGHALLAWCYRQRNAPDSGDPQQAARWWNRATTLMPAESLRQRFPLLQPLATSPGPVAFASEDPDA